LSIGENVSLVLGAFVCLGSAKLSEIPRDRGLGDSMASLAQKSGELALAGDLPPRQQLADQDSTDGGSIAWHASLYAHMHIT